jgi:hypothetical protein
MKYGVAHLVWKGREKKQMGRSSIREDKICDKVDKHEEFLVLKLNGNNQSNLMSIQHLLEIKKLIKLRAQITHKRSKQTLR